MGFLDTLNSRQSPALNKLFGITALLIIAAATWCTLTNSWIAPRIGLWQASLMDDNKYFPVLTIFLLALPPLIILMIIKLLVLKMRNADRQKRQ